MEESGFSLPTSVVEIAITYAKEKYGVFLFPELLIELYGLIKKHQAEIAKRAQTDDSLQGMAGFRAAIAVVLDERYTQKDEQETNIYNGIKGALGKIAAELKARRRKHKAPKVHTVTDRLKAQVVFDPTNPQSRFAF